MSTRAQVDMIHPNTKTYRFWIYRDGYPTGVVPNLPDDDLDFEEVRRALQLGDDRESMPDYYYAISLVDRTIEIYHADSNSKPWKRGEILFSGTFAEAKQRFYNGA
jgi:hypothetical protein